VGNQAHLLCFVKSTVYWFTGHSCGKLLRCYFHNPLIAFPNSEEIVLFGIWYICVPVYLHNLQCSICDRKCDILQKWIQPDTATFTCQLIVLLVVQPVVNIPKLWRDYFVFFFFCGILGSSMSLWFIV
jgi:hypothetical protein